MKRLICTLVLALILNSAFDIQNSQAQWVQMPNGLGSGYNITALTAINNNVLAGTIGNRIFLSTNYGTSWAPANSGLTDQNVTSIVVSGTNLFASTTWGTGGVYLSTNNGTSWTVKNNGILNRDIWELAVSGSNLFAGTAFGGIFLSTNNGTNWSTIRWGNGWLDDFVAFAFSGTKIFAGTTGGEGVILSTNNGTNWTVFNNELTTLSVTSLAISGTNLFAGTYYDTIGMGVYLSTNFGANWTAVNNGLTNKHVNTLLVSGENLIAGTIGGIYSSTNNGTNWIQKNQGFSVLPKVHSFLLTNNYLFAGTENHSAWRRPFSEILGIQNISTEIPSAYSLSQNYPNPFNPTTKIRFDVGKFPSSGGVPEGRGGLVTLKVFDIMGREVATLVNEQLAPGTYETTFDGSALSSGTYFYKLTSGDFSATKKLTLLK